MTGAKLLLGRIQTLPFTAEMGKLPKRSAFFYSTRIDGARMTALRRTF
jgi:hypothetical protein